MNIRTLPGWLPQKEMNGDIRYLGRDPWPKKEPDYQPYFIVRNLHPSWSFGYRYTAYLSGGDPPGALTLGGASTLKETVRIVDDYINSKRSS